MLYDWRGIIHVGCLSRSNICCLYDLLRAVVESFAGSGSGWTRVCRFTCTALLLVRDLFLVGYELVDCLGPSAAAVGLEVLICYTLERDCTAMILFSKLNKIFLRYFDPIHIYIYYHKNKQFLG